MTVDRRLEEYFNNVKLFHRTGDDVWVDMLQVQANTSSGPGGRAAAHFLARYDNEVANIDTS